MKFALFTNLAIAVAYTASAENDVPRTIPELFGAEQLVDIEAHCEGCQPDYCYPPTQPDFSCFKDGYPKCCTKEKGNCPNGHVPDCECEGDCNPGSGPPNRDGRCLYGADECDSDEYCALDESQCMLRIAEIYGKCKKLTQMCNMNIDPVCGCDDKTYDNACVANSSGVNVAYSGKCTKGGSSSCTYYGVDNDTCKKNGEFCNIGKGECKKRIAEFQGVCEETPDMCDLMWKPVCGCDSVTYANTCNAHSAGVNVMRNGEC